MIRCQCSRDLKVFTCNANRPLAEKIAKHLGRELGGLRVDRFADGDQKVVNIFCPDPSQESLSMLTIASQIVYVT